MNEFFVWLTGLIAILVPGAGGEPSHLYNGYIEAEYVYVAPASPGRITGLEVQAGDWVEEGAVLFVLDAGREKAALLAATAREEVARATWRNLETGSREAEVAVIRASLSKAKADQTLAAGALERSEKLNAQGLASRARLDRDRANLASANAQMAQLEAQLEVAGLPAREGQIAAARAAIDAAEADRERASYDLDNRRVTAPASGRIEQVYFMEGEVAATGTPVVSLLPPGQLKARFFIPETERMAFGLGDTLALECDGCEAGLVATVSFMASDPQHTPPIIFSRDERSRLVFMAEARIDDGAGLLPGQPITLTVQP
ncbi:MAG: HlyD family efflux transporter periplasmic adaptor subunit [Alphaproteobacteria bacterium]|nr:HlyD family efflux transporter periplasmic adaptor subunit [Alphaproteobacteria bacterium]